MYELYSYMFQCLHHLRVEDTPLIVYILQTDNAKLITNSTSPPKDISQDFLERYIFEKRDPLIYVSAVYLCAAFRSLQPESWKQETLSESKGLNVFIDI